MNTQPLVSVVTPVYNGEKHLSECIESVIAQTYQNWDYVVVNNCSTDKTAEIAENYASRDSRIRVFNNKEHLDIIPNWNNALRQISPESKYCKVLHADDFLFPECLERMVELAEANPSVGIISSYRVDGQKGVHEGGPPYPCSVVSGRGVCRKTLKSRKYYIFGSPSTRLIRADLVRKRKAYYNESYYHAGPAECFEQLQNCDFGFVHQVLSYTRRDIDAQTATFRQRYATGRPERLAWLKEYAPAYFDPDELEELFRKEERGYYRFLAQQVLNRRGKDFFDYQKKRLEQHGFHLSRKRLLYSQIRGLIGLITHPHKIKPLINQSRKHTSSKG
jgi:glycosyltransferase involved in cell wall biosynthesis